MRLLHALFAATLLISTVLPAVAAPADGAQSTQCGPGTAGSPCGGAGPASQGNASGTNQGAGNPINVITGNKHQTEIDLPALPGVLGLEIVRHYNSAQSGERAPNGIFGRGWRLSYETDLYPVANTLQIVQADGTRVIFVRDPKHPGQCGTADPANGRVVIRHTDRGDEYTWIWANGRKLSFNPQGKLIQISAPSGEFVTLTRDLSGALVKVTDPQGRSLILSYPQHRSPDHFNGAVSIDSPVGRFTYAYGSPAPKGYAGNPRELLANLVAVSLPDGVSRRYHYEDPAHPTLLTGISVQGRGGQPQRLSTWAYDEQGRGILSYKGEAPKPGQAGIEQVRLAYPAPGRTVLTNSLNQITTYTHAIVGGEYRLLEVRGAGCASCGEANVRYGYDRLGRLTEETKLNGQGQPIRAIRTERDGQGRPIKISSVAYRNGRAQPGKWQVRYEYAGDSTPPSLIARPSVISGKEAIARIDYNAAGQILEVTESGFSPLDDKGQVAATPIVRTTTYVYRSINGRSVLAAIDGPLPNGPTSDPSDSDMTRIVWDQSGSRVVAMTQPGDGPNQMQYDAAGRIVQVRNADGFATTVGYTFRGQVSTIASSGTNWARLGIKPVVESHRYDVLGNRIETGLGGAHDVPYRPRTRQSFDMAGRLLWQAEALGILKRASYDSEGKLLSSTVQTRSFEQTERYRYDDLNRLTQVTDNTGSVRNVDYGRRADSPRAASAFRVLKDDFGREVLVASASHGVLIKHYDAADRLVEQLDDRGNAQRYAYDLAGRRITHTVVPKTGTPQTTTWRYQAGRLVETIDPAQSERITYNARGLPATKTVRLKLANGAEATEITRYTYNVDGSLRSQSLPDGTRIEYERNGQGQVVALHHQTSPWTFLGWGEHVLVKDLERDLVGLKSITYGNGIQGQWQRSREGVLARVVYTRTDKESGAQSNGATQAHVGPTIEEVLNTLLPAAQAQTAPAAPSKLPGALGIPPNPHALFDARLLYDDAGNVLLQKQQGTGPQQTQAYAYDRQSQLIAAQTAPQSTPVKAAPPAHAAAVWRYHYDRNGNRVLAQENVPVTELGHTRKSTYDPESQALTTPAPGRAYAWDAQGRLAAIREGHKDLAHYRYDHRGLRVVKETAGRVEYTLYNDARQRIADLDSQGRITRQYVWLGNQLIATLDAKQPKALQAPAKGFWQELTQTAQTLWNSLAGNEDRLAFVHVNHLGAPVAATDERGRAVWQADYAPYGQVIKASATGKVPYTMALRLPGQWEDEESGLYYNDFRYYDPQAGRYLSPDPLGRMAEALGSPNAYAYVNNNPLSYIDPWGLILFAFDGTENTDDLAWLAAHNSSLSNVYKFYHDYYDDGRKQYITGVGVVYNDPYGYGDINAPLLDAGVNWSGPARIQRMVQYFNDEADAFTDDTALMDVDIIGFSRGAAQARDFANRINANTINGVYRYTNQQGQQRCQKVNFRFMGLWDTVLSDNWSGTSYNLNIVPGFQYVAQAVALNEFRDHTLPLGRANVLDPHSWGGFPLESIMGGAVPFGQTRIERGFIGAHADIGGGFGPGDDSALAKVALAWMVDQAEAAGVKMKPFNETILANPVIHDKSDAIRFGSPVAGTPIVNDSTWNSDYDIPATSSPGTGAEDREVRYLNGTKTTQRQMTGTGMTYADTEQFITFDPTRSRSDNVTGTVDMKAYLGWLNANGYHINNLTVH